MLIVAPYPSGLIINVQIDDCYKPAGLLGSHAPNNSSSNCVMHQAAIETTNASPPRPDPFRISSLRNFLPLSEETVTTRGQRLPSIIRERSVTSLAELRHPRSHRRRHSIVSNSEDEQDVERDGDRLGRERGGEGDGQRRMSSASLALNTPQLRSMRLIGNNNPRYQWYALRLS